MKNRIIFALREHNHIDHLTPVIDIMCNTKKYEIILLLIDESYDYDSDANLKYLLEQYEDLKSYLLYDIYINTDFFKFLYKIYKNAIIKRDTNRNIFIAKVFKIISALLFRIFQKYKKRIQLNIEILLNEIDCKNIKENKTILVTDHGGDKLYYEILKEFKKMNIPKVGMIHGIVMNTNSLLTVNDLSKKYLENSIDTYSDLLDYIVAYNMLNIKQISTSIVEENRKKLIQLPSLRYTSKWIEKKINNSIVFNPKITNDYSLKIVYMVSSENYNIWTEEEFRTIIMILNLKDVFLVIKPHPRSLRNVKKFKKINNNNLCVVDNNISSSSLIEWSDLVMLSSSGILMECVVKSKPILYMKYLHCNAQDIEKFNSLIFRVETRDDVLEVINVFIKDNEYNKIKIEEREEYLKDYILNDDFEENTNIYINFFESILNINSKNVLKIKKNV